MVSLAATQFSEVMRQVTSLLAKQVLEPPISPCGATYGTWWPLTTSEAGYHTGAIMQTVHDVALCIAFTHHGCPHNCSSDHTVP